MVSAVSGVSMALRKGKGFRKLEVVKEAHLLVKLVYKATRNFPRDELLGITSQLRRAVVSVPTNIIEGQARVSHKEFLKFLYIANGSLVEVEYLLGLSMDLGYLSEGRYEVIEDQRRKVAVYLTRLIKSVKASH
jgi:four helix bundle protein